jgi:hypothetical protein
MKNKLKAALVACCITATGFVSSAMANPLGRHFDIEITNITKGIVYTPFLAATHTRRVSLFEVGEEASESVGRVAEGGDIAPLKLELDEHENVFETTTTEGLLQPGESINLELTGVGNASLVSIISMLLPTNDGIVALRGAKLPRGQASSVTYFMYAYDAGTETNDELCINIPGPQCGGVPFSPEDQGEGYIYSHPGIHGEADLSRSQYQWDGAIAKVVITRKR